MKDHEFYNYKIISKPIVRFRKLYYVVKFLKFFNSYYFKEKEIKRFFFFHFFSFLKLQLNIKFNDYFNLFSSNINKIFLNNINNNIHRKYNYISIFFGFQNIPFNWDIKISSNFLVLNKLFYYNNLFKTSFIFIRTFEINNYFEQFFKIISMKIFTNILLKNFKYCQIKYFFFNLDKIFNKKINNFYCKSYLNRILYLKKYLFYFQILLRLNINLDFNYIKNLKTVLSCYVKRQINKRYSYFLLKKKFFFNKDNNYIGKFSIVYQNYKKKTNYILYSFLCLFLKKFFFFFQKLMGCHLENIYKKTFQLYNFNFILMLMNKYKFFFFQQKFYKKLLIKIIYIYYFQFLIENNFVVIQNKNFYKNINVINFLKIKENYGWQNR